MDQRKKNKLNLFLKLVMALMFLMGFFIFIYPFVVDAINNYVDQQRITKLQSSMHQRSEKKAQQRVAEMKKQNQKTQIPGAGSFEDPFKNALSDTKSPEKEYFEEHTIGAIFIPKINISLPVYDETNKLLLKKGATLLQGTSFPVGGKGTHSVITGHTGLSDKKLFTDLDQLKLNDSFFLHIENLKLAYQIKDIKVVEPHDLSKLDIQSEKDLVTLLTCTPYGINSHRLLLTGSRIAYPKEAAKKEIQKTQRYHQRRLLILLAGCLLFLTGFAYFVWRKVVLYQAKKNRYDLIFYLYDQGEPLAEMPVAILRRWKKRPIKLDGELLEATSGKNGEVFFHQIPGDNYRLAFDQAPFIKAKIWRVKDAQFHLSGRRRYLKKTQKNDYRVDRSGYRGEST
ncbi:class C sortase [Enterococcus devriesei]|uniref:class C sortase n=1 Tax=Enterococcus devriesei TaxID=319970 RepID=UPI0036D3DEDA